MSQKYSARLYEEQKPVGEENAINNSIAGAPA
jgi:hypothetical protein